MHRWGLSGMVFSMAIVGGVHIAWICGMLPGFPGAAFAGDIDQLKQQQNGVELAIVTDQLKSNIKRRCEIVRMPLTESDSTTATRINVADRQVVLDYINEEIRKGQERHIQLRGRPFDIPPCDVLLLAVK